MFHRYEKRKGRAGVAAVELALVLPFLMLLMVIAVDWARIFYYAVTVQYAARDGAYWASDYPGIFRYSSVSDAVTSENTNLDSSKITLTNEYSTDSDPRSASWQTNSTSDGSVSSIPNATYVRVTVAYSFNTVTRWPGVPDTTVITRQCVMKVAPVTPG